MRKKKIVNISLVFLLFGAILMNSSIMVNAGKYELSPKADIKAGAAASKGVWTTKKTTTSTSYTPVTKTYKTVVQKQYEQAAAWYTGVKPVSDNYYHKKGQSDLHASVCIDRTHTFSASASSGEIENWTLGLGYSYSKKTSKNVTKDIDPSFKKGYYYFGVKVRARDFRIITKTTKYKKKNGTYVFSSSASKSTGNAALYSNPLYYNWYWSKQ